MAIDSDDNTSSRRGKLAGWPRPRTSIAKSMGLNPLRIALLIVMALTGVFGGYFISRQIAPSPESANTHKTRPQAHAHKAKSGVYEESLPRDIIIESGGILKRIALPEPDAEIDLGNGTPDKDTHAKPDLGNGTQAAAQTSAAPSPDRKIASEEQSAESTMPAAKPVASERPAKAGPVETANLPNPRPASALPANIAELQKSKSDTLPPWQRFALPVQLTDKPKIVIVIDDLGLDKRRSRKTAALPGPLTMSFMAYAEDLPKQAAKTRAAGHELMLHVPMEPSSTTINPGPNVLLSGMAKEELLKNVEWNLSQMSGYVGINNHMGSRFTSDAEGMAVVIATLKEQGYLFLDSVTSGRSVAHETARDAGIPYAVRNVFLDHDDDLPAIRTQLRHIEQIARKTGLAVAIGHPRDKTIEALKEWLPKLSDKGFQLVPISAVVRIDTK